MTNIATGRDDNSLAGETYPVAAMICAIGFFMRILLSGPVLNMFGIDYGGEGGSFLGKIHPSSYVVLLSFIVLLCSRGNPFDQMLRIAWQQTAFFVFFAIYILITLYWIARGPKGVGEILDIHIVAPICAIVFSYAPRSYCKKIVYLYAGLAVVNSLIGIGESATHMRIFSFDPDWEVLKQDYFRSSAFLGHPLTNAAFAAMAMFVMLGLRMPIFAKVAIFAIMLSSLVAFGSRSALGFSVIGLILLGIIKIKDYTSKKSLSVLQLMGAVLAVILIPAACFGLLYVMLHSGIGARLLAYDNLNDASAGVRLQIWDVFRYMSFDDIFYGSDGDRNLQLASQVGVENPDSDIENPWILMFMFLGAVMFPIWLAGLIGYLWRLMKGASPSLKLALLSYFAIASTANSFGRKDPIFMLAAGVIVCVKRMYEEDKSEAV